MTEKENCNHENIRVYGNPDPYPNQGKQKGCWEMMGMDIECKDCGAKGKVEYKLTNLSF